MRARLTLLVVATLQLLGARARWLEGDWPQTAVNIGVAVVAVGLAVLARRAQA